MGRKLKPTTDLVAQRFRALRPAGASQEHMAAEIGATANEWGDYENGKRPGWDRLEEICVRWDINPAWIMWGVQPKDLDFTKGVEPRWARERFLRMINEKRAAAQPLSIDPDSITGKLRDAFPPSKTNARTSTPSQGSKGGSAQAGNPRDRSNPKKGGPKKHKG